jgi:hypothetical protein
MNRLRDYFSVGSSIVKYILDEKKRIMEEVAKQMAYFKT